MMDEKVVSALNYIKTWVEQYPKLATVCSWGKDSMVMQHLVRQIDPSMLVLWLVPPFLPEATLAFANRVIKEWNLNVKVLKSRYESDPILMTDMVYKPVLWKNNPELCCQIFKVHPAMIAVKTMDLDAWISGMRQTESEKRGMYTRVWHQADFVKLHPIIDFTEADVWRYIACHDVPVHPYYKMGYRSVGCDPCSFPNVWTSERGGRWKDTMMEGGDCGIHCTPMK